MSTAPSGDPPTDRVRPHDKTLTVANAIGIVLYLMLASRGWRPPGQSDIPITGEPFVWALALPVLGAFFLTEIVWAVLILRSWESKRWLMWTLTSAAWLLAIALDFSHH